MLRENLRELAHNLAYLAKRSWWLVWGLFVFSAHWKSERARRQAADANLHLRVKLKREAEMLAVKERAELKINRKKLPRDDRHNMAVYNYIYGVLMQAHPSQSIPEIAKQIYEYIHPYLYAYQDSHGRLGRMAFKLTTNFATGKLDDPNTMLSIAKQAHKDLSHYQEWPRLTDKAIAILEDHKQKVLKLKLQEKRLRQGRVSKDKKESEEDLKAKKEMLRRMRNEAGSQLASIEKAEQKVKAKEKA